MTELLSLKLVQYALIAGVLAGLLCGLMGVFVVIKRIVFISGGISHTSYGGLGIAHYLGLPPFLGALAFATLSAAILGNISHNKIHRNDTLIGIFWAAGMAIGILFIKLTPGYTPPLSSYLFGSILFIAISDIYIMMGLIVLLSVVFTLFYKEWIAFSFDQEFTSLKGIPVRGLNILLYTCIAFTIVVLIKIIGVVLVIALLTIPPSIALIFTNSLKKVILLSMILSVYFITSGLIVSAYFSNIPSGPAIILQAGLILLITQGLKKIFSR